MKTQAALLKVSLLAVLLCCSGKFGIAQNFNCYIANDHLVSPTVFEFDVYVGTQSVDFLLKTVQNAVTFNPGFFASGSNSTIQMVAGSSQMQSYTPATLQWIATAPGFQSGANTGTSCGNGTLVTAASPIRVATFRIISSLPFNCAPPNPNMVKTGDASPPGMAMKMAITCWNSTDCSSTGTIVMNGTYTQFVQQTLYTNINNMHPSIISQPAVASGCDGSGIATFSVTANGNGTSSSLNYQWLDDGVPLSETTPFSGTNTSTLTITVPALALSSHFYSCVVSQCSPALSSTSSGALLTVNSLPTITLGANPYVCLGATSANLNYTGTSGSPDQYSINFDAAAELAGFTDVAFSSLLASPINITIPGSVTAETYSATLTIEDTVAGCIGQGTAFSLTIIEAGTWLGTTNSDWHTSSNWCGGVPDSSTDVRIVSSTAFQPVLSSGGGECNSMTVDTGAVLTVVGTDTLKVSGNWTNHGTVNPGSGTVEFTGTGTSVIIGDDPTQQDFEDVIDSKISGGGIVFGGNTTTINLHSLTLNSGIFDPGTATQINVSGDWTNNGGTFLPGTGTVIFNGSVGQQAIEGSASTTFNNVTVNNSAGIVQVMMATSISGGLALVVGKMILNSNDLILGASALISGANSSRYIITNGSGALKQHVLNNNTEVIYPVGSSLDSYTPLSLRLSPASSPDDIKVSIADSLNPDYHLDDTLTSPIVDKPVLKEYFVNGSIPVQDDITLTVQWNTIDESPGFDRMNCNLAQYTSGAWSYNPASAANTGSIPNTYSQTRSGITTYSSFAVFSQNISCSIPASTFCGGSSLNVNYTADGGLWNVGNIFTAELSDAAGNFASATSIGSLASTSSGTINATIPPSIPAGTGYRIRVISSNPSVTGEDNGSDIRINIPFVYSINPTSGDIGTSVIINGCGFNSIATNNIVFFGSVKAIVTSASTSQLAVTVPQGASYAPITVVNGGLTAQSSLAFTPTFSCGGPRDSSEFATAIDFPANSNLQRVAIADFDGDGKNDYALTASTSSIVTIYLKTSSVSSISFAPGVDLSAGSNAYDLAVADLNNDGNIDLVVTDIVDNSISVYINNSTQGVVSFSPRLVYGTAGDPRSVAFGDINNDGKLDIIVAQRLANSVGVFQNISSGNTVSFATRVDFLTDAGPVSIAVGDIDGDGLRDVVTANSIGNNMSVLRNSFNNGSISFAPALNFASGLNAVSASISDLDGDGKNDIIIVNQSSNNFSAFRNISTPGIIAFDTKMDFSVGSTPVMGMDADTNNDGNPDQLSFSLSSDSVSVCKNLSSPGTISFAPKVGFSLSANPRHAAAGDLDNDGDPDLLVPNVGGTVSMIKNLAFDIYITAGGPTTICSGGSVTLSSSKVTGNVWSSGDTTQNITVTTSGTYSLTNGGCASGNSISVTLNPAPTATISGSTSICTGTQSPPDTALLTIDFTGTAPWSYAINGGTVQFSSINPMLIPVSPSVTTTYSITSLSDANCTSSATGSATITAIANGTWLGTTNSDWHTPSNWCGGIPDSSTDVRIVSSTAFQPVLSSGGGECNSMTVDTGAVLTVVGTDTLKVSGNWTNHGTVNPGSGTVEFTGTGTSVIIGDDPTQQDFEDVIDSKIGGGGIVFGGNTTTINLHNLTLISGTFDPGTATQVNVSGDLSVSSEGIYSSPAIGSDSLIFNGSSSQSWFDDSSASNYGDVIVSKFVGGIVGGHSMGGVIVRSLNVAAGALDLSDMLISVSGSILVSSGSSLISGPSITVGGNWTNHGTVNPGSGTVEFTGTGTSVIIGDDPTQQDFEDVIDSKISGGGIVFGGNTTTINLHSLTLNSGIFDPGTATQINVSGDWTNNGGTFLPGTGTVIFNGSGGQQAIEGSASTTFNNVTVNNSAGIVQVMMATSISGGLALVAGKMMLNSNDLILGTSALISGANSSRYIITNGSGALKQHVLNNNTEVIYPVGSSLNSYTPLSLRLSPASSPDDIKVSVADSLNPDYHLDDTLTSPIIDKPVLKEYFVNGSIPVQDDITLTVQWNTIDESPGFDRMNCNLAQYTSGAWSYNPASAANTGSIQNTHTQTRSGITTYSSIAVFSQNISCSIPASTFCGGSSLNVNYTADGGLWNAGNIFTTELSDANGNFATPIGIGSLASTSSGTINATIPPSIPAGTGYRIRVISSNPSFTGEDNGSDIAIVTLTAVASSNSPLCAGNTLNLTSSGGTIYSWTGPNAFTSSQQNPVILNASLADAGIYTVSVTDISGCTDTASTNVILTSLLTYYADADADGYGLSTNTQQLCAPAGIYTATVAGDCNDANNAVNPGTTEICNGIDDNCDLQVDEGCNVTLNLKIFIEGYYRGSGQMQSVLYNSGMSSDSTACDSVTVELHEGTTPFSIIESADGLLHTDGTAEILFLPSVINQSCYIVIRHRNTLETWSNNSVLFDTSVMNYDFSVAAIQAFGSNLANLGDGNFALYSGDVDQNGNINLIDFTVLESNSQLFLSGYLNNDLTGDGMIESADYSLIENKISLLLITIQP